MQKASLELPADINNIEVAILGNSLGDLCDAHSAVYKGHPAKPSWVLEWLFSKPVDLKILKARLEIAANIHNIQIGTDLHFIQENVPDINWLEYSYKQFPPFSIGPLFVYGSHYECETPDGQIGLQIDAATAFGSGEHGTTRGCMEAMLDLKEQGACPWNVLDMGTGSGILAIAAWKLWKTPVLAVDNDEEAVRVAEHHREINKVPAGATDMLCVHGGGFADETVCRHQPFDLIIANILPGPLKEMAADLTTCTDENGYVILSGILNEQAESVLNVYQRHGLVHHKTIKIGEWSTLILRNAPTQNN